MNKKTENILWWILLVFEVTVMSIGLQSHSIMILGSGICGMIFAVLGLNGELKYFDIKIEDEK